MSPARALGQGLYAGLKRATRRLLDGFGKLEAAAQDTRVALSALQRYQSASIEDELRFMPVDVVADLEMASHDPAVTRYLASLTGHVLVKLPDAASRCGRTAVLDFTREACEALNHVHHSLDETGAPKASEIAGRDLLREMDEAIAAAVAARRAFEIILREDEPCC